MTNTDKLAEALRGMILAFAGTRDIEGGRALAHKAERAASAALAAHEAAAQEPNADAQDAIRWRTFIGLPYAIRAEWAVNLSLAPVLTQWVDSEAKGATNAR